MENQIQNPINFNTQNSESQIHEQSIPVNIAPSLASRSTQSTKAQFDTGSIYPEATYGLIDKDTNVDNPINYLPAKVKKDKLNNLLIIGVTALGIIIAAPAILSLIGWAKIISYGDISVLNKRDTLVYAIDSFYLIVGVGLILRRELARVVYILVGVILLIFGIYGTINYFQQSHNSSTLFTYYADGAASEQSAIKSDQTSLKSYQNTSLPATQKQQIISGFETELVQDQQQYQQYKSLEKHNNNLNLLIDLIPTYIIAIIPLLFLTRRRVIAIFN